MGQVVRRNLIRRYSRIHLTRPSAIAGAGLCLRLSWVAEVRNRNHVFLRALPSNTARDKQTIEADPLTDAPRSQSIVLRYSTAQCYRGEDEPKGVTAVRSMSVVDLANDLIAPPCLEWKCKVCKTQERKTLL